MYQRKKPGNSIVSPVEFRLFIFFFVTYSLFVHWVGWNEYSRFDLTRAIVDEGRFEIDNYHNNTGDSSYYQGHYYSDKPPGLSMLAAPVYFVAKQLFDDKSTPVYISNDVILKKANSTSVILFYTNLFPSVLELNSMFLITVFTSVLFSSFGIILVYRLSGFFLRREGQRIMSVMVYGLGTLIFPYSLVFFEHSVAAFFALSSFYVIFTRQNNLRVNDALLSGVLSGAGILVSYINLLTSVAMLIYISLFYRKKILLVSAFVFGVFSGVLPLLVYNALIFGSVTETSNLYHVVSEKPIKMVLFNSDESDQKNDVRMIPLFNFRPLQIGGVLPRLLFMPSRGLFFYYPILLFSIMGLYHMRKTHPRETFLVAFSCFSVIMLNTFYTMWWSGGSFGPRYMTVLMPFLIFPMFAEMKRIKSGPARFLFLILFLVSVFHNIIGVQSFDDLDFQDGRSYVSKINTFKDVGNPLYDYYLPLSSDNGPRSHLMENIFDETPGIDIRDQTPVARQSKLFSLAPFGLIILDLKLVPLIFSATLFCVLFRSIIFKNKMIFPATLLSFSVVLFSQLSTGTMLFSNDWNPQGVNEAGRWMSMNGTVYFYSSSPQNVLLEITLLSFIEPLNVDFFVNERFSGSYDVQPQPSSFVIPYVEFGAGENVLKINSNEVCSIPRMRSLSVDGRCLGINVIGIDKLSYENKNYILFGENWYPDEGQGRWMSGNSKIYVIRNKNENLTLNVSLSGYTDNRVSLYLDGKLLVNENISSDVKNIVLENRSFEAGVNIIEIFAAEPCVVPARVGNSFDSRCLSVFLGGLNVYSPGN